MELRRSGHCLHFIKTVRGGVVTKAPNVFRGKPGLKFKNINDIYEAMDNKICDPLLTVRPKLETEDLPTGCYVGNAKNRRGHQRDKAVQGRTVFQQTDCDAGVQLEETDSDDYSFVTLKRIKKVCKAKKRRRQEFSTSIGETYETCSFIKQEPLTSEFEGSDGDAMQPLSVLRSRILKDKRKNRKRGRNNCSSSYLRTQSILEYRNVQGDQVLFSPIDIKVEVSEWSYSDCEGETELALCPISACDELVCSSGAFCDEETQKAGGCDWETEPLLLSNEGHETTEEYELTLFNDNPQYYDDEDCHFGDEVLLVTHSDGQEMGEVSKEPSSTFDKMGTTNQFITNGHPDTINSNDLDVDMLIASDEEPETANGGAIAGGTLNLDGLEKHRDVTGRDIPVSSLSVDGLTQLNANVTSSFVNKNILFEIPDQRSSPDDCLMSVTINSTGVEKRSPSSKMQHPPERLFSTRKSISPTSQKRLQKAMESAELDDEQYYRYTRKLCYSNQIDNKIGSVRRDQIKRRTEVTSGPKQIVTKSMNDRNGLCRKGILRVPRSSRSVPQFSTNCTTVQSSESVIAFSQQQMRDVDTIVTKLTRELKSMKDIIGATLRSGSYDFVPVNSSADQVRFAIQNATRVEEGARRLLSMMARDCDRFCKIMKLTGRGPAVPGNAVFKEKRKIVFADEAGGKLCDVKTFNDEIFSVESDRDMDVEAQITLLSKISEAKKLW